MSTFGIVEHFDVMKHRLTSIISGFIFNSPDLFFFQITEDDLSPEGIQKESDDSPTSFKKWRSSAAKQEPIAITLPDLLSKGTAGACPSKQY